MPFGLRLVVRPLLVLSLLPAGALIAQAGPAATVEPFAAIEQEFQAAYKAWNISYREASKSGASKDAIAELAANRPSGAAFVPRATKVLEADPAAADGAAAAIWLIRVAHVHGPQLDHSLEVLAQHHRDSARLKEIMLTLGRTPAPSVTRFLEKVHAETRAVEIRARACFALGEHLENQAGVIRSLATANAAALHSYTESHGREAIAVLETMDPVVIEARAAACFEEVLDKPDFAAIEHFGTTLGAHAERMLFELRHLTIGKVAPDIVGEDIDGTAMKLSDYRGKVVVLDFWGDW